MGKILCRFEKHLTQAQNVYSAAQRGKKMWAGLMNAAIRSVYLSSIQIDSFIPKGFAWISKVDDILNFFLTCPHRDEKESHRERVRTGH